MALYSEIEQARALTVLYERNERTVPAWLHNLANAKPTDADAGTGGVEYQYRLMVRRNDEVIHHLNMKAEQTAGFERIMNRIKKEPWNYEGITDAWIERRVVTVAPWEICVVE